MIPERHLEYILVFRMLSLRGEAPSREPRYEKGKGEAPEPGIIVPPCKSHLFAPAWFDPSRASFAGPETELKLEHVHGYRCCAGLRSTVASGTSAPVDNRACRPRLCPCGSAYGWISNDAVTPCKPQPNALGACQPNFLMRNHDSYLSRFLSLTPTPPLPSTVSNCFWLTPTKICYPAAALVVIMSVESNSQEFFEGHTGAVTALCVHPSKQHAASGQEASVGSLKPAIMVWEVASKKVVVTLKGNHVRKITALDFSPDGRFLVTIGADDMHMVAVYDW